jgi:hypothetical protein
MCPLCGALGVDVSIVNLALDECLFRESMSGRSEPSKRRRGKDSSSVGRLGGSSRRGGSLRPSEAPGLLGTVCE